MVRITLAAIALLSIAAGAAPASAQMDATSRVVSYTDLNLTNPAGVAVLKRRVNHALTAVCGDRYSSDLSAALESRRCRGDATRHTDVAMVEAVGHAQQVAIRTGARLVLAGR